jgi:predicted dehydrogenase
LTAHADLDEAMTVHAPTMVLIATSEEAHADLAVRALSRHAHVLLAKPGCLSKLEATHVARVAAERHRNVWVDWTPMWMRGFALTREYARDIGSWLTIRFARRDWIEARACGPVWDLMPHDVALALELYPYAQVEDVVATSWGDGAQATLVLTDGMIVRVEADYCAAVRERSVEIIGTDGYVAWHADIDMIFASNLDEPVEVEDDSDAITRHLGWIAESGDEADDLGRYLTVASILEAAHADIELRDARRDALKGLAVAL